MKKSKIFFGIAGGILIALMIVGVVIAFSMGNSDGVWQYVEDDTTSQNAYCTTYATGNGTNETARSRNNPTIQGALGGSDENQVRYGKSTAFEDGWYWVGLLPVYRDYDCPTAAPSNEWFDQQSGLGFDGNNVIGENLLEAMPFWIGRLTHYNHPIFLNDDDDAPQAGGWQFMEWTDLDVRVDGILCGNGQPPNEGSTLTFSYRINFDETPNGGTCKYSINNQNGCSDAVTISTAPPAAKFTCDDADEIWPGDYTISLLGFQPHNSDNCSTQTYIAGSTTNQFITAEDSTNHACLWAQISDFVPTAVMLKDFSAVIVDDGVLLRWETLSEVNTLGFNLYRSETLDGEKVLVNPELIFSNLAPGSLDGALYEYLDEANATQAYYWLEEIEADGSATSYGWTLAE